MRNLTWERKQILPRRRHLLVFQQPCRDSVRLRLTGAPWFHGVTNVRDLHLPSCELVVLESILDSLVYLFIMRHVSVTPQLSAKTKI